MKHYQSWIGLPRAPIEMFSKQLEQQPTSKDEFWNVHQEGWRTFPKDYGENSQESLPKSWQWRQWL